MSKISQNSINLFLIKVRTDEVKELHSDLQDDLKERLVRMEADVSQIKARIGL